MDHVIFETERLLVRQYNADTDAENFYRLNSDEEVMRFIRKPKSREECDQFLEEILAAYRLEPLAGRWAVTGKQGEPFIGSFAFIPVEGTKDKQLGYALLKEFWGRGYATELMVEGIRYVFSKTELDRIFGITEAANSASQRVLSKTGFVLFQNFTEKGKLLRKFILKRNRVLTDKNGQ